MKTTQKTIKGQMMKTTQNKIENKQLAIVIVLLLLAIATTAMNYKTSSDLKVLQEKVTDLEAKAKHLGAYNE